GRVVATRRHELAPIRIACDVKHAVIPEITISPRVLLDASPAEPALAVEMRMGAAGFGDVRSFPHDVPVPAQRFLLPADAGRREKENEDEGERGGRAPHSRHFSRE